MKTTARLIIAALILLLLGSLAESGADSRLYGSGVRYSGYRSGYYGHGPRVGMGVGLWFGPGWGLPGPYYYPSYYYPYYPSEQQIIIQQPEAYVQPAPQTDQQPFYWYYCKEPQGYYPYVRQCPGGWMKVVPPPPAPSSSAPE
jgi:hypothetical protein